jgi:ribosomal small subunit protein bTHX
MGRGDKRTKKGKIFKGSYGKTRFRKKKLFKLRVKKARQKVRVSQPVIEPKPEVKLSEPVIVKEDIFQPIVEMPVEKVEVLVPAQPPPTAPVEMKKEVKPKAKAVTKAPKSEEKPDTKKRGRPKKTK